jgi:hypothetical protein
MNPSIFFERPSKEMSYSQHQKVAELIGGCINGQTERDTVVRLMDDVRFELEEWIVWEDHGDSDPNIYSAHEVVYRKPEWMDKLLEARAILLEGYGDCVPLREIIATLDKAVAILSSQVVK